jgi:uncharacterized membrane protein
VTRLRTIADRLHDDDRGQIVLWLLGLCVMLLFVGGISLDLWRVFSERRALAGIADAASIAGASGIDEQIFRDENLVVLDPTLAQQRALAAIGAQTDIGSLRPPLGVSATTEEIVVELGGEVPLTLMRVLMPDTPNLSISVRAVSGPRRG